MLSDSCNNLIETENYEIRIFNESTDITFEHLIDKVSGLPRV